MGSNNGHRLRNGTRPPIYKTSIGNSENDERFRVKENLPLYGHYKQYDGNLTDRIWWKLFEGDCKATLSLIPDESVNCIVTSPPYYWQRDYGVSGQIGHEPTIQGYVDAIVSCFQDAKRVLRDDGVVFLNLGDTYYSAKGKPHGQDKKHRGRQLSRLQLRAVDGPGLGLPRKSLIGIPWRVALAMQKDGWVLRSGVVWRRPGSLPEPTAHDRPWQTHEHIFIFSRKPRYWFNRAALLGEEDIWHIPSRPDNPGAHFAPFPSALVERCIGSGCPPHGTVLDPFVGSGTTMVVALQMARNAIGIELNPKYCQFITERLSKAAQQNFLPLGVKRENGARRKVPI
jgi:DNA modification methylase